MSASHMNSAGVILTRVVVSEERDFYSRIVSVVLSTYYITFCSK